MAGKQAKIFQILTYKTSSPTPPLADTLNATSSSFSCRSRPAYAQAKSPNLPGTWSWIRRRGWHGHRASRSCGKEAERPANPDPLRASSCACRVALDDELDWTRHPIRTRPRRPAANQRRDVVCGRIPNPRPWRMLVALGPANVHYASRTQRAYLCHTPAKLVDRRMEYVERRSALS